MMSMQITNVIIFRSCILNPMTMSSNSRYIRFKLWNVFILSIALVSRSYGSNLPTSLTYIILSTRGYSPRSPAADMGTSWCDSAVTLSPIFKVPLSTHGHSENCCALCLDQNPFSPRRNSRASAAYAEKTTLPRARADVSGSFHVAVSVRGTGSVPL